MRITRFPSLTELQFLGCAAAFADSLAGEMNGAALALRRLEGRLKGSAFAYEMDLDHHRYGALIVLDRWAEVIQAFGPHLKLAKHDPILEDAPTRVQAAENILSRVNQLIDAAEAYGSELVEASVLAFQSLNATFALERAAAADTARLGPTLPNDYSEARRIFLEDLATR